MTNELSSEIYWLTWNVVLTAAMVIPYATYRTIKLGGLLQVFKTPLPGDTPFDDAWAHRAYRAHMNAFEGLALFAPLAIAIHISGSSNEITAIACATFFWARLFYAPLYYFDVPYIKTSVWSVSLVATLTLAYQLLV